MKDLSEVNLQLSQRIVVAMESGNELQEKGTYQAALEKYKESWSMLPDPKEQWDLSHWIEKCNSEVYLKQQDYESAKIWALKAVELKPPRETSSFIILGACFLGLGEERYAFNEMKKAFDMGGERAFKGFDKKYLAFFAGFKG
ncbi:hypothetical protein [Pseudomonas putida]|uniref:hypothetical protein n=1 Tax=Pseudomonas putida TaxID=303 RepID=UPI0023637DC8|nr:hypothetical protein [Pseudomonas putida]MDD2148996.1 hypothetical protein [Pseudomonas putida]HDS1710413.1 hypothetical protein [Pseudomonas putida]